MANIKSNIKTKKHTDKVHGWNKAKISGLKNSVKQARSSKAKKDLNKVYQSCDSLSRKNVIHRNKANRIKSRTAKALNKKAEAKKEVKEEKVEAKEAK